jgi:hypothetical protein
MGVCEIHISAKDAKDLQRAAKKSFAHLCEHFALLAVRFVSSQVQT